MKMRFKKWCLMLLLAIATPLHAALTIEITGGAGNQIPLAIVPFAAESMLPQSMTAIVGSDLARSGLFRLVDPASPQPPHDPAEVRYAEWTGKGAEGLVIGSISARPDGKLDVRFRLMDVVKQAQLAGFSYTITPAQLRSTAHKIADVIYEKLTGDVGVFSTQIAYVVKNGKRFELQVADADGYGAQTVLASQEPILSPVWSPDGTRLAYVSFEQKKPIVYVQNLVSGGRKQLVSVKGSASAPAWSPDGRKLAIALTRDGNSQLYMVNADGGNLQRWSANSIIDTEPDFSPDGKWIIFTSDRGGSAQIYRMPAVGGAAQRLTFDGSYNVSPHFSPDGKSFVFIQRQSGKFHVAVQDLATSQVQLLTDTPQDESPSFAPNGKMIIYATEINRRGVLAAVSSDGRVKQRLSVQAGDVREPAWGPLLKNQ
ncbi:protein TolB [Sulfurimicrobium lacus]|uniref:Tol-Pal system protein TolB n=2 Tax=Sulfurimicrobium lacus TaxID=2715678 RepID=A0A6F8VA13_9PROT|nr:protein TolB [Sulfurimicrobium lacus]